jgi:uncharacterized protein (TIGR02687 family)
MNEIAQTLTHIFTRHRIVFWYDTKHELREEFEALQLPGVEKIVLDNNEFGVKHRILRQQPEQHFLLYHEGPPPADLDNWLLDVQLAHGQFHADQTALWLAEMGLGMEFVAVVAPHADFFQAARRREALKELLRPDDAANQVRLKMLAVCAAAEPRLDAVVENLLAELAEGGADRWRLLQRSGLEPFLWQQLERAFGYQSATPALRDFAIQLFQTAYASGVGEAAPLSNDAIVFLKRWKDSVRHGEAFARLSDETAAILNVEQSLAGQELRPLLPLDYFRLIDQKIVHDLVQAVAARTLPAAEVTRIVERRRASHWYGHFKDEYAALADAARLMELLGRLDLTMRDFAEGLTQYARVWFQVDQLYRKFIFHARKSGQATLLAPVAAQVENLYSNNFLLPLNNQWQSVLDESDVWDGAPVLAQSDFYERQVAPFLERNNKVFVIISDALRYEIGEELLRRIRQEDRFEAELEPALTLLPSYTQLGMAALLPHQRLEVTASGAVLVDGESATGTENRKKILQRALPGRATALSTRALLAMSRDESRALFRDHEVVYVYQNRIDAAGDKRDTEEQVFDAAEATLDELVRLIKKLVNANVTNLLVTADHGFLYQNQPLDESDFASQEPVGAAIGLLNRRFVLGQGLTQTSSFKHFTAAAVGLAGATEMLIPKSVNRLRVRGAGSRYVHGGATLQEIVIPVLRINKKRESDISQVDVDILRGASSVITTGQLSVVFYQTAPATAKVQPRRLRAGIYTQAGQLISDRHDLLFDLPSDNPRERELPVRFILTNEADAANNQEVILRLEEPVEGTSFYRDYKTARYLLRRAFTSDFDF